MAKTRSNENDGIRASPPKPPLPSPSRTPMPSGSDCARSTFPSRLRSAASKFANPPDWIGKAVRRWELTAGLPAGVVKLRTAAQS